MSEHYDQREALHQLSKDSSKAADDVQALKGAAEFFENMATMGNPAPIAFAGAIRRVLGALEASAEESTKGFPLPTQPMVFLLAENEGVLFDPQGKFHGWIMRRHPDGLWVSVRKLEAVDPEESLPEFLRSQP